ncbi:MAG: ThiF family adenylyltransferase [Chitinophagales bacterium]|nr:ThiF family adenylyltransferase [Chitinophagales bacterium]
MKREYSVAINADINAKLLEHLIRPDGDEDLCFGLYNPSTGFNRFTGIIDEIIFPEEGDRTVHGNVSFHPQYYERVIELAVKKKKGIAFLHSHPCPGFQGMSNDDIRAETQMSGAVKSVTGLPLLGLTTGNDGTWSARYWFRANTKKKSYKKIWCNTVRVLSNNLSISFHPDVKVTINREKLLRTISAWGLKTQADISRIRVGIVGLGSVGSMVAEALSRTGFGNIVLFDFDKVEEKNLDRLMNISDKDIGKNKVDVIAKAIKCYATADNVKVNKVPLSIYEEDAYRMALDCDVLFCCVDRPHPRQILNFIAYAHSIPVIDGGILVRTNKKNTRLIGADWKIQTVGYNRPCLHCLGQFTEDHARLDKEGFFDDPSYMAGADDALKRMDAHENVFAFSMNVASLEVLQLLSLLTLPEHLAKCEQQFYHFTLRGFETDVLRQCEENCFYCSLHGQGDNTGIQPYK